MKPFNFTGKTPSKTLARIAIKKDSEGEMIKRICTHGTYTKSNGNIHNYASDTVCVGMHGRASSISKSSALLFNSHSLRAYVIVSSLKFRRFPIHGTHHNCDMLSAHNNITERYDHGRFIPIHAVRLRSI